jgi:hypothetical protein
MDPKQAEEAFRTLEPRLLAIPRDRLQEPRINPRRAGEAAREVGHALGQPEVRARFVELAGRDGFDLQLLDDLPLAAGAAWYARSKLEEASQASDAAQVPLQLFQEATGLRTRMLKVLDYHLGDDPVMAARLAAIRGGKGHQDLANDLHALADLYEQRHAELADDHRHYRGADEDAARRAAGAILQALSGSGPEVTRWTEMQSRTWTFLQQCYEQVRRAGQYLFYFEEPDELFPPLFAAARR